MFYKKRPLPTVRNMVTKLVTLPRSLDRAIKQVVKLESTDKAYVSYSKMLTYLAVLGLDRYRTFNARTRRIHRVNYVFELYYHAKKQGVDYENKPNKRNRRK